MPAKAPDNFAQIFPEHPHRRSRILISILAFVLVAGSIIVYQIKKSEYMSPVSDPQGIYGADAKPITEEYRLQVVQEMKADASTVPESVIEENRLKAVEDLRKLRDQN